MKVITKLLFVALLLGIILVVPNRASATTETCIFPQFGQCYGPLQGWMNGCAIGCTSQGGGTPTETCFSVPYSDCEPLPGGGTGCVEATNTSCWDVTSNGASCISGCITEYYEQLNVCYADYCH